MKRFTLLFTIACVVSAELVPTPLVTDPEPTQRFTAAIADTLLETHLFGQCYGISLVKIRDSDPEYWLGVVSDPVLDQLVYILGVDSLGNRYAKFIKGFDDWQNPQYFDRPVGVVCDSTVFDGNNRSYFVYTADCNHDRIVRSYYDSVDERMYFYGYMLEGVLSEPEGVACVSIPEGGSYLVIADTKNHSIRLVEIYDNLTYTVLKTYGYEGPGIGQFRTPTGTAIVPCVDSAEYYRIYVVDQRNFRVVSLLYNTAENSFVWEREYHDDNQRAAFCSIASSPYYCAYVTDVVNHKIWVFTPGLTELLYTYGSHGYDEHQFISPHDICIYQDEIAVTELWSSRTGIQYFKIIPEIREFYPHPEIFDATEDSVRINFRVEETKHYLTMSVIGAGVTLFENKEFVPGSYSVYWDGKGSDNKLVLPNVYTIKIYCGVHCVGTAHVTVKGTPRDGILAFDEHWTEEGEPYVLIGDVRIAREGKLTIDPGVKVMPTADYMITTSSGWSTSNKLVAKGTSSNPILFRPYVKLTEPVAKGEWRGIRFSNNQNNDSLVLEYCIIEGAGSDTGAIVIYNIPVVVDIDNSQILKSETYGYWESFQRALYDYSTAIFNSHFENNDSIPIRIAFSQVGNLSGNTFDDHLYEAIEVLPATIDHSDTLENLGLPYWFIKRPGFNSGFTIDNASPASCVTFTIEPGVNMLFDDSTRLQCCWPGSDNRCRIHACGNESDSIIFSTLNPSQNWIGIQFHSSSDVDTSELEYCRISYGGQEYGSQHSNLYFSNAHSPYILRHSVISHSEGLGISGNSGNDISVNPIIEDNTFAYNDSFPLSLCVNNLRGLKNNTFLENGKNEIHIKSSNYRINKSMVWRNQGVPYIIGDAAISVQGYADTVVVLEIESDNVLKFKHNGQLNVWGGDRLIARSTRFTSSDTLPWSQIQFIGADTSVIDSCVIEYNHNIPYSYVGAISIRQGSVVKIQNSIIINNVNR